VSRAAILLTCGALGLGGVAGCGSSRAKGSDAGHDSGGHDSGGDVVTKPGKIEHVVMIMQENRSFDHYFGMFPGADGFTLDAEGQPTNSNPDPRLGGRAVKVFHDSKDANSGGPHDAAGFLTCFDHGKMDGFILSVEASPSGCANPADPTCTSGSFLDVMSYKTGADIPNYWAYAKAYALLDHLFESTASWSWPMHQYIVSEWAALCTGPDPMSCTSNIGEDYPESRRFYAWTPVTYLLDEKRVSWKYYLAQGTQPDCDHDENECPPVTQLANIPSIWNPLPLFDVVQNAYEANTKVVVLDEFYKDVRAGTLPAVSWIAPTFNISEHPPQSIREGQAYVTSLINVIMNDETLWNTTAIFLFWDDWGGFYDHVPPVSVDANGYGFRTPGMIISPWVKPRYIDHGQHSFDVFIKFVEDTFLSGQRLDPKTDGRPDPRPDVREALPETGDLRTDFDFTQKPNAPLPLKPM
jgi:phospholipase C